MSEGTNSLDKAVLGDIAMVIKTMLINPDRGGDTQNEISLIENPGKFRKMESENAKLVKSPSSVLSAGIGVNHAKIEIPRKI